MTLPSHEETRDVVDVRIDPEDGDREIRQRFRTLTDKLALGTATVGVFGLDHIGLELLVAAGADGTRVVAVASDPDVTPDRLPAASRRVIASLPEAHVGHQPTALLAADVVVVSVVGAPGPVAAAGGLRAGQLVLVASAAPPGEGAESMLDEMLAAARLVRGIDVAVAWITIGPEPAVIGIDAISTELGERFLLALPDPEPAVVVTLVDDEEDGANRPRSGPPDLGPQHVGA